MLRVVLWIAAALVAVLLALAVSRSLHLGAAPTTPAPAATAPAAATPAAATIPAPAAVPAPPPPPPKTEPTPEDQQIEDDAAATGMTTVEPKEETPPT